MKKIVLLATFIVGMAFSTVSYGQTLAYTFDLNNLTYTQDFTIPSYPYEIYPTGWKGIKAGGTYHYYEIGEDIPLDCTTGEGADNSGVYLVGPPYYSNFTERAFGSRADEMIVPAFGAVFKNNTGYKIIKIDFSGFCEQWRTGGYSYVHEITYFEISFNANDLYDPDATWIKLSSFDLKEIRHDLSTASQGIDGNLDDNREYISASYENAQWQPGSNMWIRWTDVDDDGLDALMAIDDLCITVTPDVKAIPQGIAHNFDLYNMTYNQNFDGMGTGGTNYPTGWLGFQGGGNNPIMIGTTLPIEVTDGSSGNGGMFNVGTSGENDRALGSVSFYGMTVPVFGAVLKNSTCRTISKLDFSGYCEQWRTGGMSSIDEVHKFEISNDATCLNDTSATWSRVSSFDLKEKLTTTNGSYAVNGNLADNKMQITASVIVDWPHNTKVWIRWSDDQVFANNSLLAIDDLSITATLADPVLNVTRPDIGARWEQGSTYHIRWLQASIVDGVKIEIKNTASSTWNTLAENITPTNGFWAWNIPADYPTGTYKIKLTAGSKVAESVIFNIVAPILQVAHVFDVNNATYNENFDGMGPTGTNYLTGWKGVGIYHAGGSSNLLLQISNGDPAVAGEVFNTGSSGDTDRALGTRTNESQSRQPCIGAVFKNNTGSSIKYIDFSGFCEQWSTVGWNPMSGSYDEVHAFEVSFNARDIDDKLATWESVNFHLYEIVKNSYQTVAVDGNSDTYRKPISNNNYYTNHNWEQGANMWIRWTDDDPKKGKNSLLAIDDLSIAVTPAPFINVISPKTGDKWQGGSYFNIKWSHAGMTEGVKIELKNLTAGSEWTTLAENVPISKGSWEWAIPHSQQVASYRIRLTAGGISVESEIFSVENRYIFIEAPGVIGELNKWVKGTTHDIVWAIAEVMSGNVKIELTRNASAANPVWEVLVASVPVANRAWTWNITQDASNDCKIRITHELRDYSAESVTFSIIDPADVPKIFISEYIVGSGNNKAIEIYNGTGDAINLPKLKVLVYPSNSIYRREWSFGTQYLAAGNAYVIYNHGANAGIKDYGDDEYSYLFESVNGDDAIAVHYDGVLCDLFGKIGDNPASGAWDVAGVADATKNKTLLRKLNVTKGNYMPKSSFGTTAENSEWVVKETDYFGNVGGFGAVLTHGANTGLDASYDLPISDAIDTTFNLIINNNTVDVNSNLNNVNNLVLKELGNTTFTIQPNVNLNIAGSIFSKMPIAYPPNAPATASFDVLSDNTGTGTFLHNFTANGNIKRYISGNAILTANCYHGVSVPLVQSANPQSGLFMGSYLYSFNESLNQWEGMGSSTTNALDVTKGYLIYYPGDNKTYNFNGTFNYDQFTIPYTATDADKGFNFIPNPYPSHIDFSEIENFPASLSPGFWVWDNGNYRAYNVPAGTGTTTNYDTISIGQAFFVRATGAGILSLTNKCRVGNKTGKLTPFYSTGNQRNTLRIAANGNQLQDEILFVFDNKWNLGTDEGDMVKMVGSEEAPQLSSINADNEKLTLNTLPLNRYETNIPLNFTLSASTQVKFVADISSLQNDITPYLIDKKENRTVNLRQNPAYTFNHAYTDNDNRFELKLVNAVYSTPYDLADENMIYVNSNNQIVISIPDMQNTKTMVNIYDMQGKLVSSNSVYLTDTFVTQAPFVSGVYMVSVVNSTQTVNKKVVVTR
ncbi:MAG: T9SS type A sorting domain-containing protein [Lentimicrobiaceae bacterium]|nr:T9SS type A sorting domain-containing protein [Lentimicrobiaceae bacterium]